jgi:hypothetical protein
MRLVEQVVQPERIFKAVFIGSRPGSLKHGQLAVQKIEYFGIGFHVRELMNNG